MSTPFPNPDDLLKVLGPVPDLTQPDQVYHRMVDKLLTPDTCSEADLYWYDLLCNLYAVLRLAPSCYPYLTTVLAGVRYQMRASWGPSREPSHQVYEDLDQLSESFHAALNPA